MCPPAMFNCSLWDVFTELKDRDVVLVFPTHRRAIAVWPMLIEVTQRTFTDVVCTQSTITVRSIHRAIRRWIPYENEPINAPKSSYRLMSLFDPSVFPNRGVLDGSS